MSNIDVVNKHVAIKLGIKEEDVKKINDYYWRTIKTIAHSLTDQPIPLVYLTTLYPSKYLVEKKLIELIVKLRKYKRNKYTHGTPFHNRQLKVTEIISRLWVHRHNIMKHYKRIKKL